MSLTARPPDHEYNMDLRPVQSDDELEYEAARKAISEDCPCCGNRAKWMEINGDRRDGHYVQCTKCGLRTAGCSTYAIAVESWNRRVKERSQANAMNKQLATCLVFAARYAHNRETAASMVVVNALKQAWTEISKQDRDQLLKETDEATTNRSDWNDLISFAAEFEYNNQQQL